MRELESLAAAAKQRFNTAIAKAIQTWLKDLSNNGSAPSRESLFDTPAPEPDEDMTRIAQTAFAASLLMGMDHAANRLQLADPLTLTIGGSNNLPFEEAVDFLKGKITLSNEEWASIDAKMRVRAFAVARLSNPDCVEAIRGRLVAALEKGAGFEKEWENVKWIARSIDEEIVPGYWENVYRTNVQGAYNAGRLMQYQNHQPPAWELLVIEDNRTSDVCRSIISLIGPGNALPANHSFWKTYGFPPYHFQCRTIPRAVYDNEIGHGMRIENVPMKTIRSQFKPQDGFGGNPLEKESWWKLPQSMIDRANRYGVMGDIVKQTHFLGMQSYYPELLVGYTKVYSANKKGYVHMMNNWVYSEKEMDAAKRLADLGHQVLLLPSTSKAPSQDMIFDNTMGEIKHIVGNSYETIESKVFKAGYKQRASVIYVAIPDYLDEDKAKDAIIEGSHGTILQKVFMQYKDYVSWFSLKQKK